MLNEVEVKALEVSLHKREILPIAYYLQCKGQTLDRLIADWRALRSLVIEASGMLKLLDRNAKHESITAWLTKWTTLADLDRKETP